MIEPSEITNDLLWSILKDELEDATVNQIVWYYLGYRYNKLSAEWDSSAVAEVWRSEYPEPPDFIASRSATVKLTRSIPAENKQLLKQELGFSGYQINELVPRKTRRATIVNWLLNHRKEKLEQDKTLN